MKVKTIEVEVNGSKIKDTIISTNDEFAVGIKDSYHRNQIKDFMEVSSINGNFEFGNYESLVNVLSRNLKSPSLVEQYAKQIQADTEGYSGYGIVALSSAPLEAPTQSSLKLVNQYEIDGTWLTVYQYE
nr:MAG TPA: hypothetical protein [Caudoviricetes sp.]